MAQRREPLLESGAALQPASLQELLGEVAVAERKRRKRPLLSSDQPRIVERAAQDEPSHRAKVRRHRLAPQAHRLQRNRPAPGKRIQHPRRPPAKDVLHVAPVRLDPPERPSVRLNAPFPSPPKDAVPGLFPRHLPRRIRDLGNGPRHVAKQLVPRSRTLRLRQQRRQQRRPTGRQRPSRRPDVKRRDVPVPNVLLVNRVEGHLLDRKGGLDEAAIRRHPLPFTPPRCRRCSCSAPRSTAVPPPRRSRTAAHCR